jgi:hypothetical protein
MKFNKIGNIIAILSVTFLIVLASFGLLMGASLSNLDDSSMKIVINTSLPIFIVYLIFGSIGVLISITNFLIQLNRLLAILNIGLYAFILIFTILISSFYMPKIIQFDDDFLTITFATPFIIFLIASILGVVAGILKIMGD